MGLAVLLAHLLVGGEPQVLPPPPLTIEIFAPPAQHWMPQTKPLPPEHALRPRAGHDDMVQLVPNFD